MTLGTFLPILSVVIPIIVGWILDRMLGDPSWFPHPVVLFGRIIAFAEKHFNKGKPRIRKIKGAFVAFSLIIITFGSTWILLALTAKLSLILTIIIETIAIFSFLAGTTLIKEVKEVFMALNHSCDQGRRRLARIVGRDTFSLAPNEIKTATLETLAENLSDGVIAPLFWLILFGIPGMAIYKMINTMDSMIGYRNERYCDFGKFAARIDDIANYLPARITAILMLLVTKSKYKAWLFTFKYAKCHASPNSGWPEASLASILNCRFGGTHKYFGQDVFKPYIGYNAREITQEDMRKAIAINRRVETLFICFTVISLSILAYFR